MNNPTKKGDKFIDSWDNEREELTANGFFSTNGIQYETAEEAALANGVSRGDVRVANKEYNGTSTVKDCRKI